MRARCVRAGMFSVASVSVKILFHSHVHTHAHTQLHVKPKVDLDVAAVVFDEMGVVQDTAYYNQLKAMNGCLKHSGRAETACSLACSLVHTHVRTHTLSLSLSHTYSRTPILSHSPAHTGDNRDGAGEGKR